MIENRSGVNSSMHMLMWCRDGLIYMHAASGGLADSLGFYWDRLTSSDRQTAIMLKKFSVDWLAQSFHDSAHLEVLEPEKTTHRPHVPCLVQPRPPTSYDKVYLQPKPKVTKVEQNPETIKENEVMTPRHCSSPSFSENSGYSSGYESEAAASECASRRIRTKFTPEQIDKLEKIFSKHKYLDAGERVKTALKLNLSETQVRTWFQNRRMKLKREVQEMRADYLLPQMVLPVQYHFYDRQRLPFPPHGALMHQMMPHVPHHHLMMPRQHFY
ncbi:homeobox protein vent1-like [Sinocyclocheilus anshuiensis]|nr:PREDICTED: homeobox protein vent1-like [Sinocyclocheilus anshuiensis]